MGHLASNAVKLLPQGSSGGLLGTGPSLQGGGKGKAGSSSLGSLSRKGAQSRTQEYLETSLQKTRDDQTR